MLFCSFNNFNQAPPLKFAQGAGLHNFDQITDVALAGFIVGQKLVRFSYEFAIDRVLEPPLYRHGNGLVHFVTGDHSDFRFSYFSFFRHGMVICNTLHILIAFAFAASAKANF